MPAFRQSSFASGELTPKLWGRSELAWYASGARFLRNFFIAKEGAAVSRPGTYYCGDIKSGRVRLVPFIYSDTLAFVLEFGDSYIRFWLGGQQLLDDGSGHGTLSAGGLGGGGGGGGGAFEHVTTYTLAELPYLKFAQQGAVLTICHPAHAPAELRLNTATDPYDFTLTDVSFDRPVPSATARLELPPGGLPSGTSDHPQKEWLWAFTEIRRDSRGIVYESAPKYVTQAVAPTVAAWGSVPTYASGDIKYWKGHTWVSLQNSNTNHEPGTVDGTAWWGIHDGDFEAAGAPQISTVPTEVSFNPAANQIYLYLSGRYGSIATDPNFLAYRCYRGRGKYLGWVGDTKNAVFCDQGQDPDFSIQPPQGTNPFKVFNADGTVLRTENPACVTYFEQRRLFARTDNRLGFIWGSATGDYANFDSRLLPTEDGPLSMEIASAKLEEIRSLAGIGPRLIALTNSAPWVIGADQGGLAYDNLAARRQGDLGASWVDPLEVHGECLYVRGRGRGVRSIGYSIQRQGMEPRDLTVLSSHLFLPFTITAWAYAEEPYGLIWAVSSDGSLLSCTYNPEQQQCAWAKHTTPNGTFEAVCVVPDGTVDSVYVVALRRDGSNTYHRQLERLADRQEVDMGLINPCALDCSTSASFGSPTATVNVPHLGIGTEVYALVDGNVEGPHPVDSSGNVTLDNAGKEVLVGLKFVPQLQLLDVAAAGGETKLRPKNVVRVGVEVDTSRGLSAGPDFDNLKDISERQVSDSYATVAPTTGLLVAPVKGSWTKTGSVCLQQNAPLPVTVLAVTREVEFGDY